MTNQHLQAALESRDVIGQAKGILMARESISADEAFDILRRASQRSGRKLRDIAAQLIARVDPPQEPGLAMPPSRADRLSSRPRRAGPVGGRSCGSTTSAWAATSLLPPSAPPSTGAITLGDHDHDVLVQALNERFTDLAQNHPLAYADELAPP